jgi:hypothetical protein
MSLLEIITKASSNSENLVSESIYPITLNPDSVLLKLKPQTEDLKDESVVKCADDWQISHVDSEIIESAQSFFKSLKRKLSNLTTFNKDEFLGLLHQYLEKNMKIVGISVGVESSDSGYTREMIEKVGFTMGREVVGLVLEAAVVLELWELLETLIVNGRVEYSCFSNLIHNLIEKRKTDLVCLCVQHISDLQSSDLLAILKYFLSPPKDAYSSMVIVRKEWECAALWAIEKAAGNYLSAKRVNMAKDASILLMLAHDGFSASELCLHYLLASSNLDEAILSFCISKLDGSQMVAFLRYLGKWVKKYDNFPQAYHSPKFSSSLGLKICEWVPKLEDIAKCLGLVLDEHFSSLVLHPEFHQELMSMESVINSLSSEATLCCTVANLEDGLNTETQDFAG